jgi:hypothetical protein
MQIPPTVEMALGKAEETMSPLLLANVGVEVTTW